MRGLTIATRAHGADDEVLCCHERQLVAYALPTTHAVTLMRAIWGGAAWGTQLATLGALALIFAACIGFSARWFRWE